MGFFLCASQEVWESLEKLIEIVKAMLIHIHHHSPIDCETWGYPSGDGTYNQWFVLASLPRAPVTFPLIIQRFIPMLLRVDRRWRSRSFPNTPCVCHQLATCPRRGQHLPASDGSSDRQPCSSRAALRQDSATLSPRNALRKEPSSPRPPLSPRNTYFWQLLYRPCCQQLPRSCCPGRTQRSSACFALFEQPNLAPNFLPRIPGGHSSSDHVVLPGSRQRSGKFPGKGRLPLRLCGGQKSKSCFCWSKHPNHQNVFY